MLSKLENIVDSLLADLCNQYKIWGCADINFAIMIQKSIKLKDITAGNKNSLQNNEQAARKNEYNKIVLDLLFSFFRGRCEIIENNVISDQNDVHLQLKLNKILTLSQKKV